MTMRQAQLHQLVADLIDRTWTGDNADVAAAILNDDAFGALCHHLGAVGDAPDIERVWSTLAETVEGSTLDWLVDGADNPAAWLASRVPGLSGTRGREVGR